MKFPMVITQRQKHCTLQYVATTKAGFLKACVDMLNSNMAVNYYFLIPYPKSSVVTELSKEAISALPEPYRSDAERQVKEHTRQLDEHSDSKEQLDAIKNAIRDRDGLTAYRILRDRRHYEYEDFDIQWVQIYE